MLESVSVGDGQSSTIFQAIRTTLSDGLNLGDSYAQSIFEEIRTTLADTVGVGDTPLQAIFQTVAATLTETLSVTDNVAQNVFSTIVATLSDGLSAADQLFAPPAVPVSSLTVEAHSPVNIVIITPTGAQAGFGVDGKPVNQLGANMTGPGTEPESVIIPEPSMGYYQILVYGTPSAGQNGSPYTITVESIGKGGASLSQWSYTGTATPGSMGSLSVYLLSNGKVSTSLPAVSAGLEILYALLLVGLAGALGVLLLYRGSVRQFRRRHAIKRLGIRSRSTKIY